ncbi:hypothetical protein TNCT_26681 [Trichonephila clavata]|uniref:Uncharacterized protein n=1 Tax=Trichonephila clavata TaxID=2740835 RepID=A0A8X6GV68_TRICU|nr:hypothetical protein TNCT_26681 [Trichonephila clavata]
MAKSRGPSNVNGTTASSELSVATQSISQHLAAICMGKTLETWVSHALTEEQSLRHLKTFKSPPEREVRDPFLHRILTMIEK